jgi:hypothetical protein
MRRDENAVRSRRQGKPWSDRSVHAAMRISSLIQRLRLGTEWSDPSLRCIHGPDIFERDNHFAEMFLDVCLSHGRRRHSVHSAKQPAE